MLRSKKSGRVRIYSIKNEIAFKLAMSETSSLKGFEKSKFKGSIYPLKTLANRLNAEFAIKAVDENIEMARDVVLDTDVAEVTLDFKFHVKGAPVYLILSRPGMGHGFMHDFGVLNALAGKKDEIRFLIVVLLERYGDKSKKSWALDGVLKPLFDGRIEVLVEPQDDLTLIKPQYGRQLAQRIWELVLRGLKTQMPKKELPTATGVLEPL